MSRTRLTRTLAEQVERFGQALTRARRGDGTGVHQSRVASRRIREMLPLLASGASAGDTNRLRKTRREIRRVASLLGSVRELDVTRGVLDECAVRYEWRPSVVSRLRHRLDEDRRKRHADFVETLREIGGRALLRDLRRADNAVSPDGKAVLVALDERRRKRAAALGASLGELGTLYVPDRLHAVRLAAKKLRYALEAEAAVRRAPVARDIRVLTAMQEDLGHLHDLQILQDRLRGAGHDPEPAQLRRMHSDLEKECRMLHARAVSRTKTWLQLADRVARR